MMSAEPLFVNLSADSLESSISVISSLCVNCEETGETRLLLTKIPFFKDVIVSSFICSECGYSNRAILPASAIEDRGVRYELKLTRPADLQRQVVVHEGAELRLPHLDSSFPFREGRLTTIEGAITGIRDNINDTAKQAQTENPALFVQLIEFSGKLSSLLIGNEPFEMHLDDPKGTSFVENPMAPDADPQMKVVHYERTPEENERLGMTENAGAVQEEVEEAAETTGDEENDKFDPKAEVISLPVNCPQCNAPCVNKMKMVDIPHFKEVLIMATDCDACGYRDNEVKGGGGIEPKGRRLTLHLLHSSDLSRDVLKSESASLQCPELDLETVHGTLGGKFTTVEGLLTSVRDQLKQSNPFLFGDSAQSEVTETSMRLRDFVTRIDEVLSKEGDMDLHLIIDDPAGNSHIQNICAPDPDPQLVVEDYERTPEDDEILGIDKMCTEGYEDT